MSKENKLPSTLGYSYGPDSVAIAANLRGGYKTPVHGKDEGKGPKTINSKGDKNLPTER